MSKDNRSNELGFLLNKNFILDRSAVDSFMFSLEIIGSPNDDVSLKSHILSVSFNGIWFDFVVEEQGYGIYSDSVDVHDSGRFSSPEYAYQVDFEYVYLKLNTISGLSWGSCANGIEVPSSINVSDSLLKEINDMLYEETLSEIV